MPAIGIDLGTSNTCAAVTRDGVPRVIVNREGLRRTPSMVAVREDGRTLVGETARRQAAVNPKRTIFSIKRFMGRPFRSQSVAQILPRVPFVVSEGAKGEVRIRTDGKARCPEELSAMILGKVRSEAADFVGRPVDDAVITVPAHFDDRQRAATKDAGAIAGLNVLRVLNEPTAAALSYGFAHPAQRRFAVYDLGGGTFDISIVEQDGHDFRVLATAGDDFLGGDDFDRALMDWLLERVETEAGASIATDPAVLQRLRDAAEVAKRDLSTVEATEVHLPFFVKDGRAFRHVRLECHRADFDRLVTPLVERTLGPCEVALSDSGLELDRLDGVLLVGGQTRSPVVRRTVEGFFRRKPLTGVNPDEAVALGAALAAAAESGQLSDLRLHDVVPLSLGVETAGGGVRRIIPRNTPVPATASQAFTTTRDDEPLIRVHVLQGEHDRAERNRSLGFVELAGVRPAPRGDPKIEVVFEVDEDGILHVTARDEDTGRVKSVRMAGAAGLAPDEIEALIVNSARGASSAQTSERWLASFRKAEALLRRAERLLVLDAEAARTSGLLRLTLQIQYVRRALSGPPDPAYLDGECRVLETLLEGRAGNRSDPGRG